MKTIRIVSTLIVCALCVVSVSAQTAKDKRSKKSEIKPDIRNKLNREQLEAYNQMTSFPEQIKKFEDPLVAIVTFSRLAQLHLTIGETAKAKELLQSGTDLILLNLENEAVDPYRLAEVSKELVRSIAQYDPLYAASLRGKIVAGRLADKAMEFVDPNDPVGNAPLIRQSFAKKGLLQGMVPSFLEHLKKIREKDSELADSLFAEAIATAELKVPIVDMGALYALPGYKSINLIGAVGGDGVNEAAIRAFLNFAAKVIAAKVERGAQERDSVRSFEYQVLNTLVPYINEHLPTLEANEFQKNLLLIKNTLSVPETNKVVEASTATTDTEMISRAQQATSPAEKNKWYIAAIQYRLSAKKFDEAADLLSSVTNISMAKLYRLIIRDKAYHAALAKKEYLEALRHARDLPESAFRFSALQAIAEALFATDQAMSKAILVEASAALKEEPKGSITLIDKWLSLAKAAKLIDADGRYVYLIAAVAAINEVPTFKKWAERIEKRDGGNLSISFVGLVDLKPDSFADLDFWQATELARSIDEQKAEARMLILLGVYKKAFTNFKK